MNAELVIQTGLFILYMKNLQSICDDQEKTEAKNTGNSAVMLRVREDSIDEYTSDAPEERTMVLIGDPCR